MACYMCYLSLIEVYITCIGLVYFTRLVFISCIHMEHTPLNILHPLIQTSIAHSCILNQTIHVQYILSVLVWFTLQDWFL